MAKSPPAATPTATPSPAAVTVPKAPVTPRVADIAPELRLRSCLHGASALADESLELAIRAQLHPGLLLRLAGASKALHAAAVGVAGAAS